MSVFTLYDSHYCVISSLIVVNVYKRVSPIDKSASPIKNVSPMNKSVLHINKSYRLSKWTLIPCKYKYLIEEIFATYKSAPVRLFLL